MLFRKFTNEATYPVSIFLIALSLLFMHSLTSDYLNGRDVHQEIVVFNYVANTMHWNVMEFPNVLMSCISITILPTIYLNVMEIDKIYLFKLFFPFIWALTPLVCYCIINRFFNSIFSFLGAILFIFQSSYIFDLLSAMRTVMAIFYFSLVIMLLFDKTMPKFMKSLLLLIFILSLIISHYSTAYLFIYLMAIQSISLYLISKYTKINYTNKLSLSTLLITMTFTFIWYGQTKGFRDLAGFTDTAILNLVNIGGQLTRAQGSYILSSDYTIAAYIRFVLLWSIFLIIGLGVFYLIYLYYIKKYKFNIEYLLLMLISGATLLGFLVLPYVSFGYGNTRIFEQLLIILSIGFIMGLCLIGRHKLKIVREIAIIIIILQLFNSTFLFDQLLGSPFSEDLSRSGNMYNEYYIHKGEVNSAGWLLNYSINHLVYSDIYCITRFQTASIIYNDIRFMDWINSFSTYFFNKNSITTSGFIYLRTENIVNRTVQVGLYSGIKDISSYSDKFNNRSKIYDNMYSEIWT